MFISGARGYHDIINVNFCIFVDYIPENFVNNFLESCWSLPKAEEYDVPNERLALERPSFLYERDV